MTAPENTGPKNAGPSNTGPLAGLSVVSLSNTLTSATITTFLADFGAEVVQIEPPGGSPLRSQPAFPYWGRGLQSMVADFHDADDRRAVAALATGADVVIETFRPGVVERWGLSDDDLRAANPRLVYCSVTAFGRTGPYANVKGYEGLVMSLLGGHDAMGVIAARQGPAFCGAPFAWWSGAQTALHGILAALYERETSGVGQRVDATLVQGFAGHDPWNALIYHMTQQFPGAFTGAAASDKNATVPNNSLNFRLLVALTKDGRWLQFSQTTHRLFVAFMKALELDWMFDDPHWKSVPDFDDVVQREEYFERMLTAVRQKTVAEWNEVFDAAPDVWGETFRQHSELLHHPQVLHDGATATIDDPILGPVLQPAPMVQMSATPATITRSAPALDAHGSLLRAKAATAATPSGTTGQRDDASRTELPLAGVTVLELGTYYAAPYGTTLLTDLGARVIKIEQLDGDPIRNIMPFPELGAVKVLQGKDCIAVEVHADAGRQIVHDLVRRADALLVSFRAGVVERLGLDPATLLALNPDLLYISAPGYGVDGPCGHRPAFAPTIGAGSGLAFRNIGSAAPQGPDLTLDEVKRASLRISGAAMGVGQADGFSALGVCTAFLLGLLARRRGAPGQAMQTSMLRTMSHVLVEDMLEYAGRAPLTAADAGLHGLSARYRLYQAKDRWLFLAAPALHEWNAFATAMADDIDLASDARFGDETSRAANDDALATVLTEVFARRDAAEWEARLTAADVGCVVVQRAPVEQHLYGAEGLGRANGWVTDVEHPTFGTHPRLNPLVKFSRSETVVKPSALLGTHTDAVLGELGYPPERIAALRESGVIA